MDYIIIALVFSINYLIWKYPLNRMFKKIMKLSFFLEVFFALSIFLFIPYGVSLIVLNYFNFSSGLLSNVMVVFVLVFVSVATYKRMKNE